jgi:hypothetical protein
MTLRRGAGALVWSCLPIDKKATFNIASSPHASNVPHAPQAHAHALALAHRPHAMINAVLVFNNAGQPRLTKFYTQLETSVQQRLISEIFTLVANRPSSACNFLPCVLMYNPFT